MFLFQSFVYEDKMIAYDKSIRSVHSEQERPAFSFFVSCLRGSGVCPPRPPLRQIAIAFSGAFIAVSILALAASTTHTALILGSFGASCCILFGFPDAPFAQPRNVIGGHFVASLTGLVFFSLFGANWWSMGLAVATSIALMLATRTAHPPAASNPVIVMVSAPAWSFLFTPTIAGACALVMVAVVYNNVVKGRVYPKYWL
jgi:CBS-domain-containing membrane protein